MVETGRRSNPFALCSVGVAGAEEIRDETQHCLLDRSGRRVDFADAAASIWIDSINLKEYSDFSQPVINRKSISPAERGLWNEYFVCASLKRVDVALLNGQVHPRNNFLLRENHISKPIPVRNRCDTRFSVFPALFLQIPKRHIGIG